MSHGAAPGSNKPFLAAIGLVLVVYVLTLAVGWPQEATHIANGDHGGQQGGHAAPAIEHPPIAMIAPFVLILGAIAVFPLAPRVSHWWEHNLNKLYVALVLSAGTLAYYLFAHPHTIVAHWPGHALVEPTAGVNLAGAWTVLANALLYEYVPFITLLLSLYVISGGIRIQGDLPAHAITNTTFLAAGGVLASFIGTTGAAMLLVRPLLETNSERKHVKHTVIFFIFIVCNCGGCLLPIGDPPLFLGYLFGVPFLWTFALWKEWLFVNGSLLAIYFIWDHYLAYPKESPRDIALDERRVRGLRFSGLWPNVPLLLGVVLCVGLLDPGKPLPGTDWHPPFYLREVVQLSLVGLSLLLGSNAIRHANKFNYHAIIEVAALFLGIFICMQAPLQILQVKGPSLGLDQPWHFFWATGTLSSILDNAPTYVVFFQTANSLTHESGPGIITLITGEFIREDLLVGVSLGAVLMGSMTYIGNGPNFMVKSIAEQSGVKMPSFFGYMVYSCLILLPLFVLTNLLFLVPAAR